MGYNLFDGSGQTKMFYIVKCMQTGRKFTIFTGEDLKIGQQFIYALDTGEQTHVEVIRICETAKFQISYRENSSITS